MLFRILFALCISSSCLAQDFDFSILTIPDTLKYKANSLIRQDITTVDVSDSFTLNHSRRRVITVFNKVGIQDIEGYVSYSNNVRVKNVSAVVYNAFGKEIKKIKRRDFQDVSAVDNVTMYSDSRVLYMNYTPTTYPFTVVFESEVVSKTTAFIPRWMPVQGYYSATENSEYTIIFDAANKPSYKLYNFDDYNYELKETATSMTFKMRDQPSIIYEKYAPTYWETIPHARFALADFALEGYKGKANSWEEFGQWMNTDLIKDSNDLDAETKAFINNLVASKSSDEEKARAIYQYVQDKVRYVGIQIEIGGWRPMKASEVNALGYGDCKALTLYTKSLMDAVGLTSYYTIVHSDETKIDIDDEFLAAQGNHAILGVALDNDITWLECTSQSTPFGFIAGSTDDRQVLMIKDNAGVLAKTKSYSLDENTRALNGTIRLNEDKSINGQIIQSSQGVYFGEKLGLEDFNTEDKKTYYKNLWSHVNQLKIDDIQLQVDKTEIDYEETLEFSVVKYAMNAGKDIILKPNVFANHEDELPSRYTQREQPFVIQRSKQELHSITYTLPEGYTISSLPEEDIAITPFASYKVNYTLNEDNTLTYTYQLIYNEGTHDASLYEDYREFYKALIKTENQKLLITKAH